MDRFSTSQLLSSPQSGHSGISERSFFGHRGAFGHQMSKSEENGAGPPYDTILATLVEGVQEYMHLPDPAPFVLLLATVAAHRIQGPLVWLMLVGPPGCGKTELLRTILGIPKLHMTSMLTEAGLLSGTAKKEVQKNATGGLLRKIGPEGILVAKDFTTVLSMHRDERGKVLAALRELYDGKWIRHLGTDGGKEIPWEGRLGFVGAVTEAIDSHHSVIATLGDRFLYYRMASIPGPAVARKVLDRDGFSDEAIADLKDTVAIAFDQIDFSVPALAESEKDWLATVANLAALARSAVERDSYRRDITRVLRPESPGRLAGALGQLLRALSAVGCGPDEAKRLTGRVAIDCMPDDRARLLHKIGGGTPGLAIEQMRAGDGVIHPETAIRRALEEMECLGIVERTKLDRANKEGWKMTATFRAMWQTL